MKYAVYLAIAIMIAAVSPAGAHDGGGYHGGGYGYHHGGYGYHHHGGYGYHHGWGYRGGSWAWCPPGYYWNGSFCEPW